MPKKAEPIVEVWVARLVLVDRQGRKRLVVKAHDSRDEALAYLNSAAVLNLLGRHKDNRGDYWNLMEKDEKDEKDEENAR
jgi:hypothetical protein